nr:hypothetical protein [Escherichia coli]
MAKLPQTSSENIDLSLTLSVMHHGSFLSSDFQTTTFSKQTSPYWHGKIIQK